MFRRLLCLLLCLCLIPIAYASPEILSLPKSGTMVHVSPAFNPAILKGIKVQANDPFRFEFVLSQGDKTSAEAEHESNSAKADYLKEESTKLIKYFLAAITTPEKDLWVNLSPYEKDRIVPDSFGQTEMGRDLLAQDYLLKQLTASLIYPEDEIGKKFWKKVYELSSNKGVSVNTFNKVWIVPDKAVVFENIKDGTAYVVESSLKVLTEQDYLAKKVTDTFLSKSNADKMVSVTFLRDLIIPTLTKEVNEGANFAQLRQVYNSLILATWYKKKIKDSILSKVYADKNKVKGLEYDVSSPNLPAGRQVSLIGDPQRIYQQYLESFKKGAYNFIKDEIDPISKQMIPRKYFSGGFNAANMAMTATRDASMVSAPMSAVVVVVRINNIAKAQKVSGFSRRSFLVGALASGIGVSANAGDFLFSAPSSAIAIASGAVEKEEQRKDRIANILRTALLLEGVDTPSIRQYRRDHNLQAFAFQASWILITHNKNIKKILDDYEKFLRAIFDDDKKDDNEDAFKEFQLLMKELVVEAQEKRQPFSYVAYHLFANLFAFLVDNKLPPRDEDQNRSNLNVAASHLAKKIPRLKQTREVMRGILTDIYLPEALIDEILPNPAQLANNKDAAMTFSLTDIDQKPNPLDQLILTDEQTNDLMKVAELVKSMYESGLKGVVVERDEPQGIELISMDGINKISYKIKKYPGYIFKFFRVPINIDGHNPSGYKDENKRVRKVVARMAELGKLFTFNEGPIKLIGIKDDEGILVHPFGYFIVDGVGVNIEVEINTKKRIDDEFSFGRRLWALGIDSRRIMTSDLGKYHGNTVVMDKGWLTLRDAAMAGNSDRIRYKERVAYLLENYGYILSENEKAVLKELYINNPTIAQKDISSLSEIHGTKISRIKIRSINKLNEEERRKNFKNETVQAVQSFHTKPSRLTPSAADVHIFIESHGFISTKYANTRKADAWAKRHRGETIHTKDSLITVSSKLSVPLEKFTPILEEYGITIQTHPDSPEFDPDRDQAMKGGIDFNADKMTLETKLDSRVRGNDNFLGNDNNGIKFNIDQALFKQFQDAPGFTPVIIGIRPLKNLPEFLGITQ